MHPLLYLCCGKSTLLRHFKSIPETLPVRLIVNSTRGVGALEKRPFSSVHLPLADPDQACQFPLADLWQCQLHRELQTAPRLLRRFQRILAEVSGCATSLPFSRLCTHTYQPVALESWAVRRGGGEDECALREEKGRGCPMANKRHPRLASTCRVAPKRRHHPQLAKRESAPWHGFPPVSRSFVTDRVPAVEFTINHSSYLSLRARSVD